MRDNVHLSGDIVLDDCALSFGQIEKQFLEAIRLVPYADNLQTLVIQSNKKLIKTTFATHFDLELAFVDLVYDETIQRGDSIYLAVVVTR